MFHSESHRSDLHSRIGGTPMLSAPFVYVLLLFFGQLPEDSQIRPVEVARVPSYSEGIVFDGRGNAYISHGRFISLISPDGKARIWAETGSPDGHKILPDGTHLVCDESQHAVLHLD